MRQSKTPALRRFAADIHRLLSIRLQRDIDDPMLQGISVTRLELADANGEAIAYVHGILPVEHQEVIRRLNALRPHLLHHLRRAMPRKRMPELVFRWDKALDKTHQVLDTMKRVQAS